MLFSNDVQRYVSSALSAKPLAAFQVASVLDGTDDGMQTPVYSAHQCWHGTHQCDVGFGCLAVKDHFSIAGCSGKLPHLSFDLVHQRLSQIFF